MTAVSLNVRLVVANMWRFTVTRKLVCSNQKKVIAKLHFGDVFDRNPVYPITDISEFGCLIPNKYQNNKPCSILNPFTDEVQEIPTPVQFRMLNVMGGLENGDTDFHIRHVPKPRFEDEFTRLVSDMVITSKWSEELNSLFPTFKMFDVMDLISYYKND